MAEKSKDKKRSGNATLIATAIALMVSGTALWSINRSISTPGSTGTGMFPTDNRIADAPVAMTPPGTQATLAVTPPPVHDLPSDDIRMPAPSVSSVQTDPAPAAEEAASAADTAAVEVSPEAEMPADQDPAGMAQAKALAAVVPASGTDEDLHDTPETAMADPTTEDSVETAAATNTAGGASYYIAIGSYVHRGNALLVQRQRQSWHPQIREATVDGRHFYRLVVGPFSFRDLAVARARMRKAGVIGEWPVRAGRGTERADLALLDG